jgi:hypothetical protein
MTFERARVEVHRWNKVPCLHIAAVGIAALGGVVMCLGCSTDAGANTTTDAITTSEATVTGGTSEASTSTISPQSGPAGSGSPVAPIGGSAPSGSGDTLTDGSANLSTEPSSSVENTPDTSASPSTDESGQVPSGGVRIEGRKVYVNGELFHVRGVNWNPVGKGGDHPAQLDFAAFAERDIPLMKEAGINAVRTYERLEDRAVLDQLHAAGIYVFSTVLGWWQDEPSVVSQRVNAVKDHPAILVWVIGNEWNYNQLYSNGQMSTLAVRDVLNEAAALIKQVDPSRPVMTIFGELGGIDEMLETMPDIDIWGINAYRGIDHAALFVEWEKKSSKPMILTEYGADAWDARDGRENVEAQAEATRVLTQQLIDAYTTESGGITSGGFIFEWADEWWKSNEKNVDQHDTSGIAPPGGNGGPYPDGVFNEEWWGIVDIDRNPRPAYHALKALYAPE